jgi:hypothetical protein
VVSLVSMKLAKRSDKPTLRAALRHHAPTTWLTEVPKPRIQLDCTANSRSNILTISILLQAPMTHVGSQAEPTHDGLPHGWRRWVCSTNHKDIGTMYLVFALVAGLIGALLSIAMRAELMEPGLQIFSNPEVFNMLVSYHGLIMIFFTLMPALIGGYGNWMVPLMIGAPDMAFPRLNNLSFWLMPASIQLAHTGTEVVPLTIICHPPMARVNCSTAMMANSNAARRE